MYDYDFRNRWRLPLGSGHREPVREVQEWWSLGWLAVWQGLDIRCMDSYGNYMEIFSKLWTSFMIFHDNDGCSWFSTMDMHWIRYHMNICIYIGELAPGHFLAYGVDGPFSSMGYLLKRPVFNMWIARGYSWVSMYPCETILYTTSPYIPPPTNSRNMDFLLTTFHK